MSKMLTACAAIAVAAVVALPAANAAEQRADGVRNINRVDTTRVQQRRYVRQQAPTVIYSEPGYADPYAAYGFAPGYGERNVDARVTGGHAAFGFGG